MLVDTSTLDARQMRSRVALHDALERLIEGEGLGAVTVSVTSTPTFSVGEVWAAWTENARDGFAKTLKDKRARALKALAQAASRFRLAGREGADNVLSGLLGFFGDTTGAKLKAAGAIIVALGALVLKLA